MGVGDLPAIQPLLGAVLMLCVSVVQGVRTTLGMIFNCSLRDWRTVTTREVLPQATSGISYQGTHRHHGGILGLVPRISVGPSWGLSMDLLETSNRGSRHKSENDPCDVAPFRMEADPFGPRPPPL